MRARYCCKGLIIVYSDFPCFPLLFSSLFICLYFQMAFYISTLPNKLWKSSSKKNKKRNWIFLFRWNCFCSKIFWGIVSGKYALACNTEMFYGIIIKTSLQIYNCTIDEYMKNILTQCFFSFLSALLFIITLVNFWRENQSCTYASIACPFYCFLSAW